MLNTVVNYLFFIVIFLLFKNSDLDLDLLKTVFIASAFLFFASFYKKNKLTVFFIFLLCIFGLFYVGTIVSLFFDWEVKPSIQSQKTYVLITVCGFHLLIGTYFLTSFVIRSKAISPINPKKMTLNITNVKWKFRVFVIFLCIMISLFLFFKFDTLVTTTRATVKSLGYVGYFSYLMFFLAVSYSLAGFFFRIDKSKSKYIYIYYLLLSMLLAFIVFKTRTGLLLPLSSFIFGYIILAENVNVINKQSITITKAINRLTLTICVFISLLFVISMRFIRGLMETGSTDFNISVVLKRTFNGGDLGYGILSSEVIDYVQTRGIYLDGDSYLRLFYIFIPRSLWEDKPISTQRIVGEWLMPAVPNMTIPPGFFADAYINFGLLGLIVFMYFGFIFALIDMKIRSGFIYLIYLSFSFTFLFHLARGALVNPLIGFLVSVAGAYVCIHFFKFKDVIQRDTNDIK